ncbi:HAMP domain-containing sensor histidine kinase [Flavobacterium sp. SUN052]|uniref:sensor histidine kinase n=1 Tax=Flavobacterium sp. SUN052 TaxID=3002441 RepID=UPI00237E13B3|nr:HAMP domain-containing sensor histidine kinase [Flavobacterium sp. SUN052]MEC4005818.1 HAMP domain-containing sensor histidine kinase [Flavobacterium sp. SUN052]
MNLLQTQIKPFFLFTYTFFSLLLIGIIDYLTGAQISPLLLYLIPIFFIGLHKNSSKLLIWIISFIAAIIWFLAVYHSSEYPSHIIVIWNAFVRFVVFVLFGLLLFQLNERFLKLQEVNLKLESLNFEKNKIIGVAAHDLKNPIGSIDAFATLLLEDFENDYSDEVREILGYVKQLSANSFHILGSLLDVSKIESGIIEINKKNQDYISFVKKLIIFNQLVANKKNIKLNFESNLETLKFEFDENHLSEVVNNLLTNAIKFSYLNTEVFIKLDLINNEVLRTTIIDKGRGIPENEHNKLFKYFQKTSATPTNGELSTGLGLAISKKIINQHDGKIGFESKLNEGSTFFYDLYI